MLYINGSTLWNIQNICHKTFLILFSVRCQDPGQVQNAQRTGFDYSVNAVVSYRCNQCFTGGGSITCQSSGQWSPQTPQCRGKKEPLLSFFLHLLFLNRKFKSLSQVVDTWNWALFTLSANGRSYLVIVVTAVRLTKMDAKNSSAVELIPPYLDTAWTLDTPTWFLESKGKWVCLCGWGYSRRGDLFHNWWILGIHLC